MQDLDPVETQEWLDALESVLDKEGEDRAHYLMTRMGELATRTGSQLPYAHHHGHGVPANQRANAAFHEQVARHACFVGYRNRVR